MGDSEHGSGAWKCTGGIEREAVEIEPFEQLCWGYKWGDWACRRSSAVVVPGQAVTCLWGFEHHQCWGDGCAAGFSTVVGRYEGWNGGFRSCEMLHWAWAERRTEYQSCGAAEKRAGFANGEASWPVVEVSGSHDPRALRHHRRRRRVCR